MFYLQVLFTFAVISFLVFLFYYNEFDKLFYCCDSFLQFCWCRIPRLLFLALCSSSYWFLCANFFNWISFLNLNLDHYFCRHLADTIWHRFTDEVCRHQFPDTVLTISFYWYHFAVSPMCLTYNVFLWCHAFSGHLGEPVLLSVWIPLPCFHHPHHLLFSDFHCHGLLSTLWWGKESLPHFWNFNVSDLDPRLLIE